MSWYVVVCRRQFATLLLLPDLKLPFLSVQYFVNMPGPSEFDLDECLKGIRKRRSMMLPDKAIRSITGENRKNGLKVLKYIRNKIESLCEFLEKEENLQVPVEDGFDLPLILNFYKVPFNLAFENNTERSQNENITERSQNENNHTGQQTFGIPIETISEYRYSRKKVFFYLVPEELDLSNAVRELNDGLEKLKKPEDRDWLLQFSTKASKCINSYISSYEGSIPSSANASNVSENDAQIHFRSKVGSFIINFYSCFGIELRHGNKSVDPNIPTRKTKVTSDVVFHDEEECKTFVEMKGRDLRSFEEKDDRGNRRLARPEDLEPKISRKEHILQFQLCRYYWAYRLCTCVNSDYFTNHFHQLAFDDKGWLNTDQSSIPIRTKVIGIEDDGLTVQLALAAVIWDNHRRAVVKIRDDKEFLHKLSGLPASVQSNGETPSTVKSYKRRKRTNGRNKNILRYVESAEESDTTITAASPIFREKEHAPVHFSNCTDMGFVALQEDPKHTATVLCFKTDAFKRFFPDVEVKHNDPNKKVVMKIFDYKNMEVFYDKYRDDDPCFEYFIDLCYKRQTREIQSYKRIWEYNATVDEAERINVPVFHDHGHMHLKPKGDETVFRGFFIVVDYAGEGTERITEQQFKEGISYLEKMGEIGVYYPDVALRNLTVEDGKLVFIDLNSCRCYDEPVSNDDGIYLLERLYYR